MNSTCKQTLKRSHMNDQQLYKEMFHVIQEDLSVFLRIHIKSRVQWCVPIIPRVHGNGRFPGAYWPASLIKLVNSRFSERLWLKTKIVKGIDVNLWPPHSGRHTRMQTCTHMHAHTWTHIHTKIQTVVWSSNPSAGYVWKGNQSVHQKDFCIHIFMTAVFMGTKK